MAKYDHGGGCACGLYKECSCLGDVHSAKIGASIRDNSVQGGVFDPIITSAGYTKQLPTVSLDNDVLKAIRWMRAAREAITRAGGNADSVLKQFPDALLETLIRNDIHLSYNTIGALKIG